MKLVWQFAEFWPMRTTTATAETAASANGRDRKIACTNQITFHPSPVHVRVGQNLENTNIAHSCLPRLRKTVAPPMKSSNFERQPMRSCYTNVLSSRADDLQPFSKKSLSCGIQQSSDPTVETHRLSGFLKDRKTTWPMFRGRGP